ncbi:MAG: carbamoyltransferase [Nitrospirae bacterium]|nr:carbamoyltransferase [Nitrospirota bacterium]
MYVLGISAYYHDSAACIVGDGEIVAAAQEERFTRKKHDPGFPANAVRYCLREAGITPDRVDYVAFYEKPFLKFERMLETYLNFAPKGLRSFSLSMPIWLKEKLFQSKLLKDELSKSLGLGKRALVDWSTRMLFPEHHLSHAASAFFPSPYQEAAILTVDGVGEWCTATMGFGKGNKIELSHELHFPHSLGLLYSAFTYYIGFKVNSGEYKVMGLAPYGEPTYVKSIYDHLIDLKEDGSFTMNMDYFNYCTGLTMTNGKFDRLFGGPPRKPEAKLTQREMDLARSIQEVTEEIILRMARFAKKETGMKNLCLAGGVALNCVANGKILREGIFESIWIQPASGDAGGALGAALAVWYLHADRERITDGQRDSMKGAYLGPSYSDNEVGAFLNSRDIPCRKMAEDDLIETVADHIALGKVIGWCQGRMEFGPRALGSRSILGDARSPKMQSMMNLKIKYRESFRPFAPSVLAERVSDYFDLDGPSPYMLLVAPLREERRLRHAKNGAGLWGIDLLSQPRSDIPAVTHIDYSARIQTVHEETNPKYYKLIRKFERMTGYAVIVNTSFNVRGEPIVMSPEDAYRCFMRTEMDYLVLGSYLLDKKDQIPLKEVRDWRKDFELD